MKLIMYSHLQFVRSIATAEISASDFDQIASVTSRPDASTSQRRMSSMGMATIMGTEQQQQHAQRAAILRHQQFQPEQLQQQIPQVGGLATALAACAVCLHFEVFLHACFYVFCSALVGRGRGLLVPPTTSFLATSCAVRAQHPVFDGQPSRGAAHRKPYDFYPQLFAALFKHCCAFQVHALFY